LPATRGWPYGRLVAETIDAITGATSTSNAVLSILNRVLSDNLPEVEVAVNG
jgi:Na+-transporting NADH:ubiquinone oxidoreductase subunit NqrC